MKKLFLFFVVALLVGCVDYTDDFNAIDDRLDKLEQKIPTIDEQISSIQESINALEEVDSKLKESIKALEASDKANAEEITALEDADKAIEAKIAELKKYVDDALKSTKDWVNATFATLEQLNALSGEVAALKSLVDANKAEVAANLATAITNLETSLKSWVGEQLSNYYTIAEIDAKIAELQKTITDGDSALQQQLNELKSQLETIKQEVTEAYKKAIKEAIETNNGVINAKITEEISKVNGLIEELNSKLAKLQIQVDKNTEDIAKLLARIQSVSYIPTYSDGKATLEYTDSESKVTLDFEISPKDAVAELAKVWDSAISVKAVYTQTRAVEFVDMPIVRFEADAENGVISITASGENLSEEFFAGTQEASVRLAISDGNNSVTSDYISMFIQAIFTINTSGWAEMPAKVKKANLEYCYHDKLPSNNKLRNYSFCFDKEKYCALWVAYPLHKCYIAGNGHRTDDWGYDPCCIDNTYEPDLSGSYYPQGGASSNSHSRGHHLPSADRVASYADNLTTFYCTNVTPQLQSLNGGTWMSLEDNLRNKWMCSDTLYVVTGAHFADGYGYAYDNKGMGKACAVPTHYYKVVLRTKSGDSGKWVGNCSADELKCVGFWFEHKGGAPRQTMSVADIENKTGHTFFVNVPNAPKTTYNPSDWQ